MKYLIIPIALLVDIKSDLMYYHSIYCLIKGVRVDNPKTLEVLKGKKVEKPHI